MKKCRSRHCLRQESQHDQFSVVIASFPDSTPPAFYRTVYKKRAIKGWGVESGNEARLSCIQELTSTGKVHALLMYITLLHTSIQVCIS